MHPRPNRLRLWRKKGHPQKGLRCKKNNYSEKEEGFSGQRDEGYSVAGINRLGTSCVGHGGDIPQHMA